MAKVSLVGCSCLGQMRSSGNAVGSNEIISQLDRPSPVARAVTSDTPDRVCPAPSRPRPAASRSRTRGHRAHRCGDGRGALLDHPIPRSRRSRADATSSDNVCPDVSAATRARRTRLFGRIVLTVTVRRGLPLGAVPLPRRSRLSHERPLGLIAHTPCSELLLRRPAPTM